MKTGSAIPAIPVAMIAMEQCVALMMKRDIMARHTEAMNAAGMRAVTTTNTRVLTGTTMITRIRISTGVQGRIVGVASTPNGVRAITRQGYRATGMKAVEKDMVAMEDKAKMEVTGQVSNLMMTIASTAIGDIRATCMHAMTDRIDGMTMIGGIVKNATQGRTGAMIVSVKTVCHTGTITGTGSRGVIPVVGTMHGNMGGGDWRGNNEYQVGGGAGYQPSDAGTYGSYSGAGDTWDEDKAPGRKKAATSGQRSSSKKAQKSSKNTGNVSENKNTGTRKAQKDQAVKNSRNKIL